MLLSEAAAGDFRWQGEAGAWCERRLSGPQLCAVAPNVVHACSWNNAADVILLHVDPTVWPEALRAIDQETWIGAFSAVAGHDLVIWQLAVTLRKLCRQVPAPDGPHVEMVGTVLATHLMAALAKSRATGPTSKGGLSPSQLDRVKTYIDQHLTETLNVATLAREARLSPFYFIRLFKQSTGLPPRQFILKCRLLKAKELLCTGEFRVAEAAYATGFCDQSHLNRHFRKFFGFTPRALLQRRHDSQ